MIIDSKGIIQKLDKTSVLDFLKAENRSLILYGMGENGEFVYEMLRMHHIPVAAICDGSPEKYGKKIDSLIITNWENALAMYPNSLMWITIAKKSIRDEIIYKVRQAGFKPEFLIFNLKYPMAEEYYRDWDDTQQIIIVGKNPELTELHQSLTNQGFSIQSIISTDSNLNSICGRPVIQLESYSNYPKRANYIICDENKWNKVVGLLHKEGICEHIYRYIINAFGKFTPQKYSFENILFRRVFLFSTSKLNLLYHYFSDTISQQILKDLCYKCFSFYKTQDKKSKQILLPELISLRERQLDAILDHKFNTDYLKIPQEWNIISLENYITHFLQFLDVLNQCYEAKQPTILRLDGSLLSILPYNK